MVRHTRVAAILLGERLKTIEDGVSQLRELGAAEVAVVLREVFCPGGLMSPPAQCVSLSASASSPRKNASSVGNLAFQPARHGLIPARLGHAFGRDSARLRRSRAARRGHSGRRGRGLLINWVGALRQMHRDFPALSCFTARAAL